MGFLGECCRVWFGITLMLTLLPYTLFTRIVWLLGCMRCMSQRTTEDVNVCGGVLTFRLLVLLNPQIRLKKVGGKLDWSPSKQGPPAMYLMNHTSFFDFFLFFDFFCCAFLACCFSCCCFCSFRCLRSSWSCR